MLKRVSVSESLLEDLDIYEMSIQVRSRGLEDHEMSTHPDARITL